MNAIRPSQPASRFSRFLIRCFCVLAGLVPVLASAELQYITNRGSLTVFQYVGTPPAEVVIPATAYGMPVVSIYGGVFPPYTTTRNVQVPDTVTNIAGMAFYFMSGLTNISLGSGLASIDPMAFMSCDRLLNIQVSPDNTHFSSLNGLLLDKAQARLLKFPSGQAGLVDIPASVTSIGWGAFDFTNRLEIAIPAGVVSINSSAFSSCSRLQGFVVDPANPVYGSLDGMLTDAARTRVLLFPPGRGGDYTIPAGVLELAGGPLPKTGG